MTLKANSLSAGSWMAFLDTLHQSESTLRYATYAISCTILGIQDDNSQLRKNIHSVFARASEGFEGSSKGY